MEKQENTKVVTGLPNFKKKGSICLTNCSYIIVHQVAKSLGMNVVQNTENWDLYWCDSSMTIKRAKELKKYQKTNHFLGVSEISRKDSLARNLNRMMKYFQDDYNFFPKTWNLPFDYSKLNTYMNKNKFSTYILKPSAGSRGIGIYLSKSMETINKYASMICQLYISNPLLIDGFKFDMRVYVLLASCDPLKIYVYNDGIVRLATEPYKKPARENLKNVFMHLTNYSVNKSSPAYVDNEISGSKRRITTLNKRLVNEGYDVKKIWDEIDDAIVKTIILAYPFVNRSYKTCFSGHKTIPACFEILGFDILLDNNCKPHLLEVNHSPDLNTHTKLDKNVKRELLTDTFKLLQLDKTFKRLTSLEQKWKIENTLVADKNIYKEKVIEYQKKFEQYNDAWESNNMGNFRLVFSKENSSMYEHYFYKNEISLYGNIGHPVLQLQEKLGVKSSKSQNSVFMSSQSSTKPSRKHLQKSFINHIKTISNMSSESKTNKIIIREKKIKRHQSILKANQLIINVIRETTLNNKLSSTQNMSLEQKQITSDKVELCETTEDLKCREELETIKRKNKKKFPNVTSRLFDKYIANKKNIPAGWKEVLIDQIEENMRLAFMFGRAELISKLEIKELIYNKFMELNNLRQQDHIDYEMYQKKKDLFKNIHLTVTE